MQLNIQLQSMKRNDLPVTQYLQQVKLIAEELPAARRSVHTSALNSLIYKNLGLEFSEVVSALAVRGGNPLSFAELSSALTNHETHLNHSKSVELMTAISKKPEANLMPFSGGGRKGG